MKYILVTTTFESGPEANVQMSDILEQRLGACCQIDKVISHYRWRGKEETKEEVRLTIKTKASLYKELETLIKNTHTYKNPEIIATPIIDGSAPYLDWIEKETK